MSQDTSTGNPSGSGGSSRRSEAEAAFSEYLARREHGEAPDFETFCADRPALADELRHLHEQWLRFQSFNQRLKERFGKDADPGVSLDPREESPSGPSSALLSQLAAHSPDTSRYKLEGEIARGGMGAIVKVWDGDLRRHLAMKVVLGRTGAADKGATPAVDERTLGRFLEEAQVTGQLDHPGVVPVHELGLDDQGRVYFTMRLVKGRDLKTILELVREGQEDWNPTRALGVLLKACEALAYAHSKGVVHRDLKPANVMVGRFGEVYVMDWGLARVMGRPDRKDIRLKVPATTSLASLETLRKDAAHETPDSPLITMDGDVVGTPAYMPPEQARGEVEAIGPRADVYSMGAILYELLAGRMPYVPPGAKLSPRTILAAVIAGPPQSVHALRPGVPAELEAICEKAMAREPAARYADVLELAEDLRAYIEGRVVRAHRTGAVVELRKWVVRNKPLAAALLLLAGGLSATLVYKLRSDNYRFWGTLLAEEAVRRTNDVRTLSAMQELKELVERADKLWPSVPSKLPEYERWLEDARILVDGSPGDLDRGILPHPGLKDHEARLAELRKRALPRSPEQVESDSFGYAAAQDRWWDFQLSGLVSDLKAFTDDASGLDSKGISSEHGWGILKRVDVARLIEDRNSSPEGSQRWSEAIDAISRSPYYGGLMLKPQEGLLPIGADAKSGLWEFWHMSSGNEPKRGADGRLVLTESTGIVFVLIPGGTFWMGAQADDPAGRNYDPQAALDEQPVHEVELPAYFVSKYEMTQGQWRWLTGADPFYVSDSLLKPAAQLSWDDATNLLLRMGLTLPTEAQWERGVRGGTNTPWWTGLQASTLRGKENVDVSGEGHGNMVQVGRLEPNPFGLYDMCGNAIEWCEEVYTSYPDHPDPSFRPHDHGKRLRSMRGGWYSAEAPLVRSACRNHAVPEGRDDSFGLRPVLGVTP